MDQIFDENGFVKKEDDPVWESICQKLNKNNTGKQLTTKNLHIYVSQDRCGILSALKKYTSGISEDKHDETLGNVKSIKYDVEKKLINLQNDALYKPVIKEIVVSPFAILQCWNDIFKCVSFLVVQENIYIFGIVGYFCENFVAPDGSESSTIFLFALGVEVSEEFVPICQVIAEKTTLESLFTRVFSKCVKDGLVIPKKIKIDHIWNHFTAINSVFNVNVKPEDYLSMCFVNKLYLEKNSYLLTENFESDQKLKELPRCIITTSNRFLIIEVMQWECIKNNRMDNVRKFEIYCIILLSMQKSLNDFQKVLEEIFAFSFSTFQSENSRKLFNSIINKIDDLKISSIFGTTIESMNHFKDVLVPETSANLFSILSNMFL